MTHPALSFGTGATVGVASGVIGRGGAEPALLAFPHFSARLAVAVDLVTSLIVLAATFPFRTAAVPVAHLLPYLPAVLGMFAG